MCVFFFFLPDVRDVVKFFSGSEDCLWWPSQVPLIIIFFNRSKFHQQDRVQPIMVLDIEVYWRSKGIRAFSPSLTPTYSFPSALCLEGLSFSSQQWALCWPRKAGRRVVVNCAVPLHSGMSLGWYQTRSLNFSLCVSVSCPSSGPSSASRIFPSTSNFTTFPLGPLFPGPLLHFGECYF